MPQAELLKLALQRYGQDDPEIIMDKLRMAQSNLKVAHEKELNQDLIESFEKQIELLSIAWDSKSTTV